LVRFFKGREPVGGDQPTIRERGMKPPRQEKKILRILNSPKVGRSLRGEKEEGKSVGRVLRPF